MMEAALIQATTGISGLLRKHFSTVLRGHSTLEKVLAAEASLMACVGLEEALLTMMLGSPLETPVGDGTICYPTSKR
jgi:hypothetical protein